MSKALLGVGDISLPPLRPRKQTLRRWRRRVPDSEGWWLWREDYGRDRTERLLIVCGRRHSEVADDHELALELGGKHSDRDDNYWQGTDTKTMGGYWIKESNTSP